MRFHFLVAFFATKACATVAAFRFLGDGFRMRLVEYTGRLKYVIKSPMLKPCVGIMLHNIIIADQQISGDYDQRIEGCL
jgi:hypothetical protein